MKRVLRIWLDELNALPDYSLSVPTGTCHGRTWKRERFVIGGVPWVVGQYWQIGPRVYALFYEVELLQGPRRSSEKSRFVITCEQAASRTREALRRLNAIKEIT